MAEAESPRARPRDVHPPDLPELLGPDLQVVQGSAHSHHYLVAVTGSHADVLSVGLLPLAHQGFGLLTNQSHRGRGDLGREKERAPLLTARTPPPFRHGPREVLQTLLLISSTDLV